MPARRLEGGGHEAVCTGRCANEEAEFRKGWTRGSVLTRMLGPEGGGLGVPHRLEKETSVSENAEPQRG